MSNVALLMSVYISELGGTSDHNVCNALNRKIILLYEGITSKSEVRGLHHESLSVDDTISRIIKSLCYRSCERLFHSSSTVPHKLKGVPRGTLRVILLGLKCSIDEP